MIKKLAIEAYLLVDRLDTLSWQLAREQNHQSFERVDRILKKAKARYYRRYHELQSQSSTDISTKD